MPGNYELDLFRTGVIGDPYYALNPLEVQRLENRHVWYHRAFSLAPGQLEGAILRFEGLDTFADVYVNGRHVLAAENMLIPHEAQLSRLRAGENEILVHIKPCAIMTRAYDIPVGARGNQYWYGMIGVRKAAHMYGWDISPRMLSASIWRPVSIVYRKADHIKDVFVYTSRVTEQGDADITAVFTAELAGDFVQDYAVHVRGVCGDSVFEKRTALWHTMGQVSLRVPNAKLWWPRNAGEANLYTVTVTLLRDGEVVDTYTITTGLRTIALTRTSHVDELGNGDFTFHVNNRKIFICGTNWVFADALHSNDVHRIPTMLSLLDDIGCNAVRTWGGNVYEDDLFYDYCDAHGILIWQDFAMGCAVYPRDKRFMDLFEEEAAAVIKRLRNHPALMVWVGDNECDEAAAQWDILSRNPNENTITRRLLPELLAMHDFTRPYLPSSPYIDQACYDKGPQLNTERHLWGPRGYFKDDYYTRSPAHFVSEVGFHGCPSPAALRRFLSPEALWPCEGNREWYLHSAIPEHEMNPDAPWAYRIGLMSRQIREFFGQAPEDLPTYARASQIVQAEAVKYIVELFRYGRWRRSGLLWWNLIDGWPQISDAVIDYSFIKKLAYHYIKRAQQPVAMTFGEGEYRSTDRWKLPLRAVNDLDHAVEVACEAIDLAHGDERVYAGSFTVQPGAVCTVWEKDFSIADRAFYLIRWRHGETEGRNHYLQGLPAFDYAQYTGWLARAGMDAFEGFEDDA